uniref:Cardiomyopathy-associated protein 5 n=1 Tax=Globodera pallida TaxID=36090 RepID=A0A183BHZ9_GLOPA
MEKEEPVPKDVEDEHIQVRKISMDTEPKDQEIIQEEVARAEHPEMFVTTALDRVDNEVKGQTVPMTPSELLEQVPPVAAPSTTAEPQAEHFVVEKTSPTISKRFQPNSESFVTDSDAEVTVLEDEDVEHELKHRQELMEQMRGEGPSPAEQLQQIREDQLRQTEMESPITKIAEEQTENAIVQELRQTHYEQQPVVWLETVPAEQTPYEAEEVAQKQTLHGFEEEQELPTSSSTDSLKPWFSAALKGIAGTVTEAAAAATTFRGSEEEQVQEEHERNLELEDSLAFEDQHPGENGIEYRDDMIFRPEEVSAQIAKMEPRPREQQGKEKAEAGWPELEPSADVKPWRSEEEEYYLPEENAPKTEIREKEIPAAVFTEDELMIPEEVTPKERVPATGFPEEELMIPEEVTPKERVPATGFPEEELMIPEEVTPEEKASEFPEAELSVSEEVMPEERVPAAVFSEEDFMIPEEVTPEEKASEFPEAELSVPEEVMPEKSVPVAVYPEEELMIPEEVTSEERVPETMFPEEELMIPEEVTPEERVPAAVFPEEELMIAEEVTSEERVPETMFPEVELTIPEEVTPEKRVPETMFPEEELMIPEEVTSKEKVPAAVFPEEESMIPEEVPETMFPEEELMILEEVTSEERVPGTIFPEVELMIPEEVTPEERVPETMSPEEESMIPEEVTPEEKASKFPEAELSVPEEVMPEESVPVAVFPEDELMIPAEVTPEKALTVQKTELPEAKVPEEKSPEAESTEDVRDEKFPKSKDQQLIDEKLLVEQELPGVILVEMPEEKNEDQRQQLSDEQSNLLVTENVPRQIAHSLEEQQKPKVAQPPPLSPLNSEEQELSGMDEGSEEGSTHTIILRPKPISDDEQQQVEQTDQKKTRSLYGAITPDQEEFTAEDRSRTPSTPVMSASRWKSMDEQTPALSSPSPIIEITLAPDEPEEVEDEQFMIKPVRDVQDPAGAIHDKELKEIGEEHLLLVDTEMVMKKRSWKNKLKFKLLQNQLKMHKKLLQIMMQT